MRLLLDTNAILAVLRDAVPMSASTEALLSLPASEKLVSIVSFWEMSIKAALGKLRMARPPELILEEFEERQIATILPIRASHLRELRALPHHHRDPFDRLIVAQALGEDCTLVSSDAQLDAYGVTRLW